MSTEGSTRRRRRSDIEDEEDADIIRSSQRSTPSTPDSQKRARIHASDSDTPPESPENEQTAANSHGQQTNGVGGVINGGPSRSEDEDEGGAGGFQPGAIVRVKLKNFVTYAETTFWPGPNLNMIIGPNGTGKSSLVCAICLGLGWGPQHLGRAGHIGEFVKHGLDAAYIEIELQRRNRESQNHIVGLKIIRDGNGREWFLNGKRTSLKAIQSLTKSLSIQIDNLCQFLPQDKVSEFAALSPVELLIQTQRAAAPEQMLEWHDELKKKRKDQKLVDEQLDRDKEQLGTLETRQDSLRAEVQRLEERKEIQDIVTRLKRSIPFVEYRILRDKHKKLKEDKKVAERRLRTLNSQVGPTLEKVNHKEEYVAQVRHFITEKKRILRNEEQAADRCVRDIEQFNETLEKNVEAMTSEQDAGNKATADSKRLERNISDLEARRQKPEPEFNGPEFNERTREKEAEGRKLNSEQTSLNTQYAALAGRGVAIRAEIDSAKQQLATFDSQQGQQQHKLEKFSRDTATAWRWIQEHQDEFEKEVYGPPCVTCSIKDSRYTAAVEALLAKNDFLAITAQTRNDFKKLQDQLFGAGGMRLTSVTLRSVSQSLDQIKQQNKSLTRDRLGQYGLDGCALDFVDGPEPVLAMLCNSKRLTNAGVSLQDITEGQYNLLVDSDCSSWVSGRSFNKVVKRSEYGAGATSTTTNTIQEPVFWTNAPVDTSARREIEAKITDLQGQLQELAKQAEPMKASINTIKEDIKIIRSEIAAIKEEKASKQKIHGEWAALPVKIEHAQDIHQKKIEDIKTIREHMKNLRTQHDRTVLKKVEKVLKHKDLVDAIRRCHHELVDAHIRLIEGESDVETLKEMNKDIVERLELEKSRVEEANSLIQASKAKGDQLSQVIREITTPEADGYDYFAQIPEDKTVEELEFEITTQESRLDYIHANNPNAIRDFERRQVEVDKLKTRIAEAQDKLDRLARSILKVRGKWEPELDKLITQISDAFSHNFEQIGCAGQVGIHKDEDFDQWSIEIKVKFRETEQLQILDQHRQSGGERSVSTIFYLMSLQALARAPFRVVDEINQGMDPRNERMVHERMVEIACKEHTSQYFLITPKLLTGLRYDKRMKVHCIASGEHMPQDHTKMDVQKILAIRRAIVAAG